MRTTGSALGRPDTHVGSPERHTPRSEQPAGSSHPVELAHRRLRACPEDDTDGARHAAMGKTTCTNMRTCPAPDNARSWMTDMQVIARHQDRGALRLAWQAARRRTRCRRRQRTDRCGIGATVRSPRVTPCRGSTSDCPRGRNATAPAGPRPRRRARGRWRGTRRCRCRRRDRQRRCR